MAKGIMVIDGQRVPFDGERNVLAVIRKAGIDIPTFCYYSELSVHGACRMCIVEDVKTGKIDASCSMEPRDGMEIRTNTARLLKHRRMILELLLAAHDCSCTTCAKSGNCRLQELAQRFGVRHIRFPNNKPRYERDYTSYAVFRDPNKCILCGDCVRVCEELQGQGILNFAFRGSELQVMPAFDKKLEETKCVGCGQCAAVCTTGAITVNDQIGTAWAAIHDPKKRVVVQIAPAVRVAVGEAFGIPAGVNVIDKMTTALKLMGVDEVYDTNFGADMTTILEAEEFLRTPAWWRWRGSSCTLPRRRAAASVRPAGRARSGCWRRWSGSSPTREAPTIWSCWRRSAIPSPTRRCAAWDRRPASRSCPRCGISGRTICTMWWITTVLYATDADGGWRSRRICVRAAASAPRTVPWRPSPASSACRIPSTTRSASIAAHAGARVPSALSTP